MLVMGMSPKHEPEVTHGACQCLACEDKRLALHRRRQQDTDVPSTKDSEHKKLRFQRRRHKEVAASTDEQVTTSDMCLQKAVFMSRRSSAPCSCDVFVTPSIMASAAAASQKIEAGIAARGTSDTGTDCTLAKPPLHATTFEDLDLHGDTSVERKIQETPKEASLLGAARAGCYVSVQTILSEGVHPDEQDDDGMTALMWAAKSASLTCSKRESRIEVMRVLLDSHASVNAEDDNGATALMHCVASGQTSMSTAMQKGGPLTLERANMNTSMVSALKLLLKGGGDMNHCTCKGFTPLMLAASVGSTSHVRLLLGAGANIDDQDEDGWSALLWASSRGWSDVVRLLMKEGASFDEKDKKLWELAHPPEMDHRLSAIRKYLFGNSEHSA
eukprot:TRINITY_DN2303_c0_g1_i1.p1 TRINITY_DN2303_c0_g1~~TRINITY_DN2303_c0_g1_i1.p1  ORF type:complete len:387 (-),score=91.47 TRINITY_DN2303_c0_g1_i1:225-1385(-)